MTDYDPDRECERDARETEEATREPAQAYLCCDNPRCSLCHGSGVFCEGDE